MCSTDSIEIQRIAQTYGAKTPFLRPPELATDTAGKLDVLKHLVNFCENEKEINYDIFYIFSKMQKSYYMGTLKYKYFKLVDFQRQIKKKNP